MIMVQLNPTIPVQTSKGYGFAVGWVYWSPDHSLVWIVAISDTREFWAIPNEEVRADKNWSMWRRGGPGENEIQPVKL